MTKEHRSTEEGLAKARRRSEKAEAEKADAEGFRVDLDGLASLQKQVGNQAMQRLVQRGGDDPFEIDYETAGRIDRERSGGQPLETSAQERMSAEMEQDFSDVRVHSSPESDDLNRQLSAKAFTTGRDIFFREGAYDPHSSGGQELIAHELTHVVQQSSGAVGAGGNKMTVNAPGDTFEQEADAVAKSVMTPGSAGEAASSGLQRQEEGEAAVQMQGDSAITEEDEESVQMQPDTAIPDEEEEPVQMQVDETALDDEEELE